MFAESIQDACQDLSPLACLVAKERFLWVCPRDVEGDLSLIPDDLCLSLHFLVVGSALLVVNLHVGFGFDKFEPL